MVAYPTAASLRLLVESNNALFKFANIQTLGERTRA